MPPLVALVALLALSATGCGSTGRARIVHGDDARENLDGAMRKAGVLFAPLYDPHGEAVDGGGGARDGCLEDANGAVERALKQRYRLTQIAPSGNDDATSTWPKIPAYAREAPGDTKGEDDDAGYFWRGLVTNLLNPKAAAFYVVVLPAFIDPSGPLLAQSLIRSATYVGVATLIHAVIVLAAGATAGFVGSNLGVRIRQVPALALAAIAIWFAVATAR